MQRDLGVEWPVPVNEGRDGVGVGGRPSCSNSVLRLCAVVSMRSSSRGWVWTGSPVRVRRVVQGGSSSPVFQATLGTVIQDHAES